MSIYYDYVGYDELVPNEKAINNAIQNILLTRRGSLPGKPRFGSDLYKILFEQIDHITQELIKTYIISAITEFEPRVVIQEVIVQDIPEYNRVIANIKYTYLINGVNTIGNTTLVLRD